MHIRESAHFWKEGGARQARSSHHQLIFGFASDGICKLKEISANTVTEMLSSGVGLKCGIASRNFSLPKNCTFDWTMNIYAIAQCQMSMIEHDRGVLVEELRQVCSRFQDLEIFLVWQCQVGNARLAMPGWQCRTRQVINKFSSKCVYT